ncbi:MAG: type II secretion system GspH family protein [Proteobacteria bacterium]|nr:type II secretion system GspH family protein [Pseudomonadota bacterium]MBU1389548.1 type II secretion system GspH family protein [Pseudomonadota bacterium]MBU1544412.1 type II secretion system GspH family protein [Pseudomonadota bacterium]MBU2480686.1 type II secretion system GspH family protein [Pseudomonadota bacterium]
MFKKGQLGNQKGFTLVEIIAVLLLLGILSAVALPKYIGMQTATEYQTLNIALNDMRSRAVLAYAASVLANNGTAQAGDQTDFSDIGLPDLAAVQAAYKDFGGGSGVWAYTSATAIDYTMAYGGAQITFAVTSAGSSTDPMVISIDPLP